MSLKPYSVVRRFHISTGHRVFDPTSKCYVPHGHNFLVDIHARSSKLNSMGMVMDFSVLKQKIGTWLDANWDHTAIYYQGDEECLTNFGPTHIKAGKPIYILSKNPTVENLAEHLLTEICPKLMEGTGVEVWKVDMQETESCRAELEFE